MLNTCPFCSNLSIQSLVDTVKAGLRNNGKQGFYQHHASVQDVQMSASAGCDVCSFLITCFQGYSDCNRKSVWGFDGDRSWATWMGSECEPSDSLLTAALHAPKSDVRIRILPRGTSHLDSLEKADVLDMLYVEIGSSAEDDMHDDDDNDDASTMDIIAEYPVMSFKVVVPPHSRLALSGWRIGNYEIDPDLRSKTNLCLAKKWLGDCQNKHKHCLQNWVPELPTRVVDVGNAEDIGSIRVVHSNGQRAPYVALSHCWGGHIDMALTQAKLTSYEESLLYDDLPLSFQDAVTITRALGIQYLWIDALCIVQDSSRDWESESKKMGFVYRDSTVTLSAMASTGSEHGIFAGATQAGAAASPPPIHLPVYPGNDSPPDMVKIERADVNEETLFRLHSDGPLCARGWCLQESILSPRHLYYGERQIYWRCPAGYRAADGSWYGNQVPENRFPNLSTVIHSTLLEPSSWQRLLPGPPPTATMLEEFYSLVEQYSHRKLTVASDKLPALSGISQRIHEALPGSYLAGLWSCDIASGLLWRARSRSCVHVKKYRAPSWSWAITDMPIEFSGRGILITHNHFTLSLLSERFEYRDNSDPYGEVISGSIVVRGFTLPLQRSSQSMQRKRLWDVPGTAYYDSEPSNTLEKDSHEPEELPGYESWGRTYLQMVDETASPYLLSLLATLLGGNSDTEEPADSTPKQAAKNENKIKNIDRNLFSPGEHISLIVRVDDVTDPDAGTIIWARGLILRRLESSPKQENNVFERIGMFKYSLSSTEALRTWCMADVEIV